MPEAELPFVQLFTDGSCRGNPGPGGWAFILRHPESGRELERTGGEPETTNNRMEMTAVIAGLTALKVPSRVELQTDSQYVGKGISEWMPGWKKLGWKRREGKALKPVANVELWQELDVLIAKHKIEYRWIRGHNGHPENERCDKLATDAAKKAAGGSGDEG